MEGLCFEEELKGVALGVWGCGLATNCVGDFAPGEASGDSEGKDSRVLAEVGVTRECLRDPILTVLDLREAVDSWEAARSRLVSLLLPLPLRPAILIEADG